MFDDNNRGYTGFCIVFGSFELRRGGHHRFPKSGDT